MGNLKSKKNKEPQVLPESNYKTMENHIKFYSDLEQALRYAGLESCQLIVGIASEKFNGWQDEESFTFNNLHTISNIKNPYQQVLGIMCQILSAFDLYGFGGKLNTNKLVFPFQTININGFIVESPSIRSEGTSESYNMISGDIGMLGPFSLAPIIQKAIEIVSIRKSYHILLIITDGRLDDINKSINAIVEASKFPLSIVCIGVGKGPWDKLMSVSDNIPERDFDNFQFVNFHEMVDRCEGEAVEFAKNALLKVPIQYEYIKTHLLKTFLSLP